MSFLANIFLHQQPQPNWQKSARRENKRIGLWLTESPFLRVTRQQLPLASVTQNQRDLPWDTVDFGSNPSIVLRMKLVAI